MRQPIASSLALALGLAAALALVSCGGGEDAKLLPGNTAKEITENLDRVKQYAAEGECVGAEDAVGEVGTQVEALGDVDPKLKEALQRGTERLREVVAGCEEGAEEETETIAPSTEAPSTEEETEKVPPGQEKKAEREREEEGEQGEGDDKGGKHEPPPAEASPKEPPTNPAPPPSEGGGTGATGGVGPGAAVEGGGD